NSLVERTANPKQLTDFFMGIRLIGATQLEEEFLLALKKYERLYGLSLLPSIIE
ncbi:MAG TPA: XRE family transcriptional regulator, partial [Enterococcus sp.]|nr:XRE family transcriptional regulator [Enterococcus sp.]